jgi:hypothetical protein
MLTSIMNSFLLTHDEAVEMIANNIFQAYNNVGMNCSSLVANEILFLDKDDWACPGNLSIVEAILYAAGGPRAHQAKFSFNIKTNN